MSVQQIPANFHFCKEERGCTVCDELREHPDRSFQVRLVLTYSGRGAQDKEPQSYEIMFVPKGCLFFKYGLGTYGDPDHEPSGRDMAPAPPGGQKEV